MKTNCRPSSLSILLLIMLVMPVAAFGQFEREVQPTIIERTYEIGDSMGTVRVVSSRNEGESQLSVMSDLFEVSVPPEGITDLPVPDWENLRLFRTFDRDGKASPGARRVNLHIQVPLRGQERGSSWEGIWVQFDFDHEGHVDRQLHKRLKVDRETHVFWQPWPIGSENSVPEVLQAAEDNSIRVNILGAVNSPGTYRLDAGTNLLDGLIAAGGLNRLSSSRVILTTAGGDGESVKKTISIDRIIDSRSEPPILKDGTVVYVREKW